MPGSPSTDAGYPLRSRSAPCTVTSFARRDDDTNRGRGVRHRQLREDLGLVAFDGLRADPELSCDLLARQALGDQGEHLTLTAGEAGRIAPGRRVDRGVQRDRQLGHARVGRDGDGPGPEPGPLAADEDDAHPTTPELAGGALGAWELDVHGDGVRQHTRTDGIVRVRGRADGDDAGTACQRRGDPLGEHGMTVGDDDRDAHAKITSSTNPFVANCFILAASASSLSTRSSSSRSARLSRARSGVRGWETMMPRCPRSSGCSSGSSRSSTSFSPARLPMILISVSLPGTRPDSRMSLRARSMMLTGSPISSVKTSPPPDMAADWSTRQTASCR